MTAEAATETLEDLAARATGGEAAALDRLLRRIQDPVYSLAVRMLGDVGDAEDATQEILLRVVTHLGSFRAESRLLTWVYRVAANHLSDERVRQGKRPQPGFDEIGALLDQGLRDHATSTSTPVDQLLVEEMRLVCTQGMLQALDREQRLAFVLSDIFELPGDVAAAILDVTPVAHRQRVSRARERLADFMRPRCGVFDANNLCRCDKQTTTAQALGLLPREPALVRLARKGDPPRDAQELLGLLDVAAVMRTHPEHQAPPGILEGLRRALARPSA
jgi:RNA polymerase sigma factor (sigma-70 family)